MIKVLQTLAVIVSSVFFMIFFRYVFSFYGWLATVVGISGKDTDLFQVGGTMMTALAVFLSIGLWLDEEEEEEKENE